MKKILFVINTMGRAGAETALLELLKRLDGNPAEYEISLYVIMGQGEMIDKLPPHVRLRNPGFDSRSVLSRRGTAPMIRTVLTAFLRNGGFCRKLCHTLGLLWDGAKRRTIQVDKMLWRALSDGAHRFPETFDLAVAWLEGASAYYVADHVRAVRKCAFVHIDYESAGYTRKMDRDCWNHFDRIFAVSDEVKEHFAAYYPEYASRLGVFHNIVDYEAIRSRAREPGGFRDKYDGLRLLTVGRLTRQKAYDIAIDAMKRIKDSGVRARWYVLGEGDQRKALEKKIAALGLQEDFVLLGADANPFPYYAQADLYIHATRFEGKSIAIQEAQALGCAILASDCNGNREQIRNGEDGRLCPLTPEAIAGEVISLLEDESERRRLGQAARQKTLTQEREQDPGLLLELLE